MKMSAIPKWAVVLLMVTSIYVEREASIPNILAVAMCGDFCYDINLSDAV